MSDEYKADIWEEVDRLRAALAERDAQLQASKLAYRVVAENNVKLGQDLAERDAAYRDLAAEHEARMAELEEYEHVGTGPAMYELTQQVAARDATIAQLRAEWDKTDAALVAAVRRVDELRGASKKLRRDITGDIEWTATQFREFMNHAQELCDAVDRIYAATGAGEGK